MQQIHLQRCRRSKTADFSKAGISVGKVALGIGEKNADRRSLTEEAKLFLALSELGISGGKLICLLFQSHTLLLNLLRFAK